MASALAFLRCFATCSRATDVEADASPSEPPLLTVQPAGLEVAKALRMACRSIVDKEPSNSKTSNRLCSDEIVGRIGGGLPSDPSRSVEGPATSGRDELDVPPSQPPMGVG